MTRQQRFRPVRFAPPAAMPDVAMLLCAGLGTRMRPLTATLPKPLVPVAGRAMLDWSLDHLAAAGIARAVVNVHYLADLIEAHAARRSGPPSIAISDERSDRLETGGGVVRALPLLGADNFFVINTDNIWVDGAMNTLHALARHWQPAQMDALLLVIPSARAVGYDGPGDFRMDQTGRLSRRMAGRVAPFVFTGIQILKASLFRNVPDGAFSLNFVYDRALAAGRLFGLTHHGQWFHVGTVSAVAEAEAALDRD